MKAAAALVLLAPSVFAAEPPAIPLTKGTTWVYRGTVRGDNEKNDRVVKNVTTTMRVVDHWMAGKYEVAVMEAGPFDVSCSNDKPVEGVSTLLFARAGDSMWQLRVEDTKPFKSEKAVSLEIGSDPPYLIQPLQGRASISAAQKKVENVKGVDPQPLRAVYTRTVRAEEDETTEELVPGIGITHYRYEHHHVPCHQDLTLVEYRPGR